MPSVCHTAQLGDAWILCRVIGAAFAKSLWPLVMAPNGSNPLYLRIFATVFVADTRYEVPSNAGVFHACNSLASISETTVPPTVSKQPLLRRLSEPAGCCVCTCSSIHRLTDMEGTIAFVVPELSERTLMNVSNNNNNNNSQTISNAP